MYIPLEKPNTKPCKLYATRTEMQSWERQSDGSEYKKTLRRPGLHPGPRWGSLQRSRKPPSWWGGLAVPSPRTPSLLSALRAWSPLLPHSKISSDAVGCGFAKNVPNVLIKFQSGTKNNTKYSNVVWSWNAWNGSCEGSSYVGMMMWNYFRGLTFCSCKRRN